MGEAGRGQRLRQLYRRPVQLVGRIGSAAADGTAFTSFLAKLNACSSPDGTTIGGGFAGHCDWRLPTYAELESIFDFDACFIEGRACVPAIFGPTAQYYYWSSISHGPDEAFFVDFSIGFDGEEPSNRPSPSARGRLCNSTCTRAGAADKLLVRARSSFIPARSRDDESRRPRLTSTEWGPTLSAARSFSRPPAPRNGDPRDFQYASSVRHASSIVKRWTRHKRALANGHAARSQAGQSNLRQGSG